MSAAADIRRTTRIEAFFELIDAAIVAAAWSTWLIYVLLGHEEYYTTAHGALVRFLQMAFLEGGIYFFCCGAFGGGHFRQDFRAK